MSVAAKTTAPTKPNVSTSTPLTVADTLWACELLAIEELSRTWQRTARTPRLHTDDALAIEPAHVRQHISDIISNSDAFCRRNNEAFLMATHAGQAADERWRIIHWATLNPAKDASTIKPLLAELLEYGDVEVTVFKDTAWHEATTDKPGARVAERSWSKPLDNTSRQPDQPQQISLPATLEIDAIHAEVTTQHYLGLNEPTICLTARNADSTAALTDAEKEAVCFGATMAAYTENPQDNGPHSRELNSAGYTLVSETWHLPGSQSRDTDT